MESGFMFISRGLGGKGGGTPRLPCLPEWPMPAALVKLGAETVDTFEDHRREDGSCLYDERVS